MPPKFPEIYKRNKARTYDLDVAYILPGIMPFLYSVFTYFAMIFCACFVHACVCLCASIVDICRQSPISPLTILIGSPQLYRKLTIRNDLVTAN